MGALFRQVLAEAVGLPEFLKGRVAVNLQGIVLQDISENDGRMADRFAPKGERRADGQEITGCHIAVDVYKEGFRGLTARSYRGQAGHTDVHVMMPGPFHGLVEERLGGWITVGRIQGKGFQAAGKAENIADIDLLYPQVMDEIDIAGQLPDIIPVRHEGNGKLVLQAGPAKQADRLYDLFENHFRLEILYRLFGVAVQGDIDFGNGIFLQLGDLFRRKLHGIGEKRELHAGIYLQDQVHHFEQMLVQDGLESGEIKEGSMLDHWTKPFCKKNELVEFHYLNNAVMDLCPVVIDKAVLTLQVAGAHRLDADGIRIISNILPEAQRNPLSELAPGYLLHFPNRNFNCFQHIIKIINNPYFKDSIIFRKSAATSEAPPTSPPSTSGLLNSSLALPAFTLPP